MAQVQAAADQQDLIIGAAGQQWGVPKAILDGVYALETGSGKNVATSSAGAVGAFQFLPSTAKAYNYPVTNNVTPSVFSQQAYGAAHYLSDIFNNRLPGQKGNHNWDTTLQLYSGGGYGLAKVNANSGKAPVNNAFSGPIGAANSAVNAISDVPGAITGAFNQAVTDAKYAAVLVGVLVVAVVLMTHGLRSDGPTNRPMVIPV